MREISSRIARLAGTEELTENEDLKSKELPMSCFLRFAAVLTFGLAAVSPVQAATPQRSGTLARINATQSQNWSGYNQGALSHALFHRVTGDWIVPTATQHTAGRAENSSVWIGIGGGCITDDCLAPDNTLIQAGTQQDISPTGAATYTAWYEIIPLPALTITTVPVNAGDQIHCDISEGTPGLWTISLVNKTVGKSFSTTLPYPSTYGSAEWIVETPIVASTNGAGFAAMPNLSVVKFTSAAANSLAANLDSKQQFQLVDGTGTVVATPSAPGSNKTSFNVCTYAKSCAAP